MKIDLNSIDREGFMIHEHFVGDELVYLVQPQHIGCKFTQRNKIFRSSVWNMKGELVSASFPKFVNWGENPENFPVPTSFNHSCIVDKLDGSTLIFSKYKGNLITRTRGTVDARKINNGDEIDVLIQEYSILDAFTGENNHTSSFSIIMEWYSARNIIVLNYGDKPKLWLTGYINHEDYSLMPQSQLDDYAKKFNWLRPDTYSFASIEDVLKSVEILQDKEGVCFYSKNGQEIHKIKSARYCALHRMKSELCSLDRVVDLFFVLHKPDYQEFYDYIQSNFDFELAEQSRGFISKISNAKSEVEKILKSMDEFIEKNNLKNVSRRDSAAKIIGAYGETNRSQFLFIKLDGRDIVTDSYKKLLYQVLNK